MNTATIPEKPLLAPWWRVTRDVQKVTFHYGDAAILCEGNNAGAVVMDLVGRLNGEHTVDQILKMYDEPAQTLIVKALEAFARNNLLTSGPSVSVQIPAQLADAAYFVAATQPRETTVAQDLAKLRSLRVGVIGNSAVSADVQRLLIGEGTARRLAWTPTDEELDATDIVCVAPTPDELPRLTTWNERALEAHVTWFQVLPYDGSFAAVGPLYIPGETCCYRCFQHRRAANQSYPAEFFWAMQNTPARYPQLAALDAMAAGLAALALIRWHARRDASLPGRFQSIEVNREIALSAHTVYRVPRCEACASAAAVAAPAPWFEEVAR